MHVISREREENASWREDRMGRGESGKRAKRIAKPAGRCRAMTPHSVYGSDVDRLHATYANTVRHYAMGEPTVTEFYDRPVECFAELTVFDSETLSLSWASLAKTDGNRDGEVTTREVTTAWSSEEFFNKITNHKRGGKLYWWSTDPFRQGLPSY